MRILFIGESWLGSCGRSLKEALGRCSEVELEEINEDSWFPSPTTFMLRAVNRVLDPAYRREFSEHVLTCARGFHPDVVMVYKGHPIRAELVEAIRKQGALTVNVYPDCSPHAHGETHRAAVGAYDLVISTKPYHPSLWSEIYGYDNPCKFIPQGYDPLLHLVESPPKNYEFDLVLVATWRPEYAQIMKGLARCLGSDAIRVGIGGHGWARSRSELPRHWVFPGVVSGRRYVEWLRKGRICVAPVTRDIYIQGQRQPGDVDTTRTYELAAANCFFLHRRTDYVQTVYSEKIEVPMYDSPEDLAALIVRFMPNEEERRRFADAAHKRAVPVYSLDARAVDILQLVREYLDRRP